MFDKILAQIKAWIDRREKPEPVRCVACEGPVLGDGYTFRGEPFCSSLCVPPFMVGDGREIPTLAGEPGR